MSTGTDAFFICTPQSAGCKQVSSFCSTSSELQDSVDCGDWIRFLDSSRRGPVMEQAKRLRGQVNTTPDHGQEQI